MKVSVIIPIWKRHDLTKVVFSHLKRQQEKYGFKVIVAGSEGKTSRDIARGFNFAYIETPNLPISDKNNELIKATKDLDSDLVCLIGSDDFVSDSYFDWVNTLDPNFEGFYGLNDLYYYSTKTRDLKYFSGYDGYKQSMGLGRVFTKSLLKKMNYKLWSGYQNKGLDTNCSKFVKSKGGKEVIEKPNVFLLDVKHCYNITSHVIMKTAEPKSRLLIQQNLGTETFREISSLKYIEGNDTVNNPKTINDKIMDNRVEIEITEAKAGMQVGDKRKVAKHIAKALIKRGIAKLVEEKKEEKREAKKEEIKEVDYSKKTFKQLKEEFPEIEAKTKKAFLKELENVDTK